MKWTSDTKGEVERGRATTEVEIPTEVDTMGEHILTAEFQENRKYAQSSASTELYLGYHTYVHCPPIFIYKSQLANLILKATIICNSKLVDGCSGKFKINQTTVSDKISFNDGYVEYPYDGTGLENSKTTPLYLFKTAGSVTRNINPAESNQAEINIMDINSEFTALEVSVPTVFCGDNTNIPLVARVYKLLHSSVIDQSDIPRGGSITFYIATPSSTSAMDDMTLMGNSEITTSGYAFLTCSADITKGVYTVLACYTPEEGSTLYDSETWGAGTLYYDPDLIQPSITTDQTFIYNEGDTVNAQFISDYELTGTVCIYIDEQLVTCQTVKGVTDLEFEWTLGLKETTEQLWCYPGAHYMVVRYETTDGYTWDYPFIFWIRYDTLIRFDETYGYNSRISNVKVLRQHNPFDVYVRNVNLSTDDEEVLVPKEIVYLSLTRSRPLLELDDSEFIWTNGDTVEFTFTTDYEITGTITVLLDGTTVYTASVSGVDEWTPSFIVPTDGSCSTFGEHTLIIRFTDSDGKVTDYKYTYFIRYATSTSIERVYDDNNNPIYIDTVWGQYPKAANPLGVLVENTDDVNVVPTGEVELTLVYLNLKTPPTITASESPFVVTDGVNSILYFLCDEELDGSFVLSFQDDVVGSRNVTSTSLWCDCLIPKGTEYGDYTITLSYFDSDLDEFTYTFDIFVRYDTYPLFTNLEESDELDLVNKDIDLATFKNWYSIKDYSIFVSGYSDGTYIYSGIYGFTYYDAPLSGGDEWNVTMHVSTTSDNRYMMFMVATVSEDKSSYESVGELYYDNKGNVKLLDTELEDYTISVDTTMTVGLSSSGDGTLTAHIVTTGLESHSTYWRTAVLEDALDSDTDYYIGIRKWGGGNVVLSYLNIPVKQKVLPTSEAGLLDVTMENMDVSDKTPTGSVELTLKK